MCEARSAMPMLAEPGSPSGTRRRGHQPVPAVSGDCSGITYQDFEGTSDYNSLQLTLSRQTGRRLQYLVRTRSAEPKARSATSIASAIPSSRPVLMGSVTKTARTC